jgi:hypothetical protein
MLICRLLAGPRQAWVQLIHKLVSSTDMAWQPLSIPLFNFNCYDVGRSSTFTCTTQCVFFKDDWSFRIWRSLWRRPRLDYTEMSRPLFLQVLRPSLHRLAGRFFRFLIPPARKFSTVCRKSFIFSWQLFADAYAFMIYTFVTLHQVKQHFYCLMWRDLWGKLLRCVKNALQYADITKCQRYPNTDRWRATWIWIKSQPPTERGRKLNVFL